MAKENSEDHAARMTARHYWLCALKADNMADRLAFAYRAQMIALYVVGHVPHTAGS